MKISEVIQKLQIIHEMKGDLDVTYLDAEFTDSSLPIESIKVVTSENSSVPEVWIT